VTPIIQVTVEKEKQIHIREEKIEIKGKNRIKKPVGQKRNRK